MLSDEKESIIPEAVQKHFVDWAYLVVDEPHLSLGAKFLADIRAFVKVRDDHVSIFENYFSNLDEADLCAAVGLIEVEGFGIHKNEIQCLRSTALTALGSRRKAILTAIGLYPDDLADYDMWGFRDTFTEQELMWLSMGFEPTKTLDDALEEFKHGRSKLEDTIGNEALKRLNIIKRSGTLGSHGTWQVKGPNALEWFNSINLDAPRGFRTMIEVSAKRQNGDSQKETAKKTEPQSKTEELKLTSQERSTLLKLIAAMACEQYGFNPMAARSDTASRIRDDVEQIGQTMDSKTIRKWLVEAATFVDDDYWKSNL
jgi:hypothetical protein